MSAETPDDRVCGWCGRRVLDDGGCPPCDWVWGQPLTRAQYARVKEIRDADENVGPMEAITLMEAEWEARAN